MQGRNSCDRREGQGDPAGPCAVTELNPIVTVTQGNRQVPLGAVAIHRDFLKSVGVGASVLNASHISQTKAEVGSAVSLCSLAVLIADFPEHVAH